MVGPIRNWCSLARRAYRWVNKTASILSGLFGCAIGGSIVGGHLRHAVFCFLVRVVSLRGTRGLCRLHIAQGEEGRFIESRLRRLGRVWCRGCYLAVCRWHCFSVGDLLTSTVTWIDDWSGRIVGGQQVLSGNVVESSCTGPRLMSKAFGKQLYLRPHSKGTRTALN